MPLDSTRGIPAAMVIRFATLDDLPLIVHHRRQMFVDMRTAGWEDLSEHDAGTGAWLRRKLPAGEYVGWLAENERGEVIGGAGVWIMDWPPHPADPTARRGCVMNVYVRSDYRRQGVARKLVTALIEWCREQGIRILILNASAEGRPLYAALGFEAGNDMTLMMGKPSS